jgi:hypothetical protein
MSLSNNNINSNGHKNEAYFNNEMPHYDNLKINEPVGLSKHDLGNVKISLSPLPSKENTKET